MWVSSTFFQEYMTVQAAKLAIVDAAFNACFPQSEARSTKPTML
jgi:hypothetical protein